ncbi:ornithine cyclodeaminase [Bacillus sp. JCM 19046]|nr:ornithine cyclodeaminase [Bacillus sp. JCM 19046]
MISDGAHITAIGADEPGKSELSADLIKRAYFVCDDRKLVSEMGAIAGARLVQTAIDAEIGEIIHSEQRGRKVSEKVTIYAPVGLAFQDLICAWYVYEQAKKKNVGNVVSFLK